MARQLAAVVIPIYKEIPDKDELISLHQCLKILGTHPIVFVCGNNFNTSAYEKLCRKFNIEPQITRYDDFYFQSVAGYIRLLLWRPFYADFKDYQYILIYQLDAYVFKDELKIWCDKGFSYIGAPWFEGQDQSDEKSPFMQVSGNGGFSLRNVAAFLKVFDAFQITNTPEKIWAEYAHFSWPVRLLRLPIIGLRLLGLRNNSSYERNQFILNEDLYWSFIAPKIWQGFKVASSQQAIPFAFECQPQRMYALNNSQLPFGCHAWRKYDFSFWQKFIPEIPPE